MREASQVELSDILGISTRQIHNLEREGMPHRAEGNRKFYPLPGAVQWYLQRKQDEAISGVEATDFEAARARRELARAQLAELELAREIGSVIPKEVVAEVYGTKMLDVLRAGIQNMPGRWGAQIVGLTTPREGEAILKRIATEMLEHFSGPAADELERGESARLPDDFPGRQHLVSAGIETMSDLLGVDELRSIPGIGRATERRIRDALSENGRAA